MHPQRTLRDLGDRTSQKVLNLAGASYNKHFHDQPAILEPLTLQPNSLPRLPLPNLKHHLHRHEKRPARRRQKHHPGKTPHNPTNQALQPVPAHSKPHQIRRHHHEHIAHGADAANDTVGRGVGFPRLGREEIAGGDFGEDEEGDEPAPDEEAELDVVPERDEGEHDQHIRHRSRRSLVPRHAAAAA